MCDTNSALSLEREEGQPKATARTRIQQASLKCLDFIRQHVILHQPPCLSPFLASARIAASKTLHLLQPLFLSYVFLYIVYVFLSRFSCHPTRNMHMRMH